MLRRDQFAPCNVGELESLQADLAAVEAVLDSHLSHVRDLQRTRDHTKTALEMRSSLAAPIRKLPPEVLLRAFSFAISVSRHSSWHPRIVLPAVCAHWRRLLLRETRFWTDIKIPGNPNRIARYLERSQTHPLTIRFSANGSFQDLRLLYSLRPRLRKLSASSELLALLYVVSGAPSLSLVHREESQTPITNHWEATDVPHLRVVSLFGANFGRGKLWLPWEQLTSLDMGFTTVADIGTILAQSLRLLSFSAHIKGGEDEIDEVPSSPLPLRTLILEGDAVECISCIFLSRAGGASRARSSARSSRLLLLPELRVLGVDHLTIRSKESHDLLSHHCPRVEMLRVSRANAELSRVEVASLLIAAPTLRMVRLLGKSSRVLASSVVFKAPLRRQKLHKDDEAHAPRNAKAPNLKKFTWHDDVVLFYKLQTKFPENIEATRLELGADSLRDELEHLLYL
ncbi:hypothetical protein HMN09_00279400 [Mycena chlorophos]|uniref:F-box domain-containing protein n=1 Tax=Mycena chlorophos TaxID=658473 RepID=A0A8H6WJ18_MYCCL|nr:hypothetical protein HMN09_00279400 [Mycena chlorophos]